MSLSSLKMLGPVEFGVAEAVQQDAENLFLLRENPFSSMQVIFLKAKRDRDYFEALKEFAETIKAGRRDKYCPILPCLIFILKWLDRER